MSGAALGMSRGCIGTLWGLLGAGGGGGCMEVSGAALGLYGRAVLELQLGIGGLHWGVVGTACGGAALGNFSGGA